MKKLIVCLLLVSCSTPEPVVLTTPIESTFDISDSKLKAIVNEPPTPEKATIKNEKVAKKKIKSHKPVKQVVTPKVEFVPPADYPKEFTELDKKYDDLWDAVKPVIKTGEVSVFDISFIGVHIGQAKITNMGIEELGGRKTYHSQLYVKSARYYSGIYSLDDYLDAYIDCETLTPIKYSLRQRESRQKVDELEIFSVKERKSYYWYKREKKGKTKKREEVGYTPRYFLDQFSGVVFTRGIDFSKFLKVEFPIVSRAELSFMKLENLGKETVEINDRAYSAWKIKAEMSLHDGLKKQGDLFFWYNADGDHELLKFEGKVKIGFVRGELVSFTRGED